MQIPAEALFTTQHGRVCFVLAEEGMRGIASMISAIMNGTAAEVRLLESEVERLVQDPQDAGVLEPLVDYALPEARFTATALARGTIFVLLFACLERVLRVIAEDHAPNPTAVRRHLNGNRDIGKVRAYLSYLRDDLSLTFSIPAHLEVLLRWENRRRNQFVHGDWEWLYDDPREVDFVAPLRAITALLTELETSSSAAES